MMPVNEKAKDKILVGLFSIRTWKKSAMFFVSFENEEEERFKASILSFDHFPMQLSKVSLLVLSFFFDEKDNFRVR